MTTRGRHYSERSFNFATTGSHKLFKMMRARRAELTASDSKGSTVEQSTNTVGSSPIGILLIGNSQRDEFRPAVCRCEAATPVALIRRVDDLESAAQLIDQTEWYPHLIVVCQSWPDEFPSTVVQRLLGQLPLSRWICAFGAWCEADGRNRDVWPLAIRIEARNVVSRINRELAVLQGACPPLPLTASRDEIHSIGIGALAGTDSRDDQVALVSPDRELRNLYRDVLLADGFDAVAAETTSVSNTASAIVWDADPWDSHSQQQLGVLQAQNVNRPIVAVMGFAHPPDVAALKTAGAWRVVAKLTSVQEIVSAVRDAVSGSPSDAQTI